MSISEVGYFLDRRELADVIVRARDALTDDGHLLLCHWRHEIVGWPLDGPDVHEAFLATGARGAGRAPGARLRAARARALVLTRPD